MKTVGFMRNSAQPNRLVELTAKISKYYNTEIVYMRPKDIDINAGKVNGQILVNDDWHEVVMEIPPIIDISPYCFKRRNKKVIDYLRANVLLTDNRMNRINKERLQVELKKDPNYSDLVIPTKKVQSFTDLGIFLKQHKIVVLKPVRSEKDEVFIR